MSSYLQIFLIWLLVMATLVAGAYYHEYITDFWWGTIFGVWIGTGIGMFFQSHKDEKIKKKKMAQYIVGVMNMSRSPTKEEVCGMLAEALDIKGWRWWLRKVLEEIEAKRSENSDHKCK